MGKFFIGTFFIIVAFFGFVQEWDYLSQELAPNILQPFINALPGGS